MITCSCCVPKLTEEALDTEVGTPIISVTKEGLGTAGALPTAQLQCPLEPSQPDLTLLRWLIVALHLSFPAHNIDYFLHAFSGLQNSCVVPSLVRFWWKEWLPFFPVRNNDGLLTHNMPKTFYYRWKCTLKAFTQIKIATHLTHYTIPQV